MRRLQPDLPPINADTNQIQQVLVNIIVNGADAMKDGGTLTVTSRLKTARYPRRARGMSDESAPGASATGVEVTVEDTGVGIPARHLSRLFEPFFSTKGGRGTGLGLAISWGIVQEHGGTIDVSSEEGKGTVFSVFLPAVEDGLSAGNEQEKVDEAI